MPFRTRCTWVVGDERCILDGRETPPDDRVLCRTHRDELIEARRRHLDNHERRVTRRASDARMFAP